MVTPFDTLRTDITNPRVWQGIIDEAPLPGGVIFDRFLPMEDAAADRILVEIRKQAARVLAPFADRDAEAPTMLLGDVYTQAWFDALQIKHKLRLNPDDLYWIRMYGDSPYQNPAGRQAAVLRRRIEDGMQRLNDAVDWRIEWLRAQTLQGSVVVTPDDVSPVSINITYPVSTATDTDWVDDPANADVLLDLFNWTQNSGVYAQGVVYKYLIVPRPVMQALAINAKLRALSTTYTPQTITPTVLGVSDVARIIQARAGLEVIESSAVYTTRTFDGATPTDTTVPMLAANKVLLLPDMPVGKTYTTPQVLKDYATGKYTWTNDYRNNPGMQDPPRMEMGVGWGGMPALTFPKYVIVATVGS